MMDKQKKAPKQNDLKKTEEEKEQYRQSYLRALADYHNLEKRIRSDREDTARSAKEDLITRLLNVLDTMEKAEVFVQDEGLKMVKKQLVDTLEEEGLKEIEIEGQEFDPHVAEAIEVEESDKDNQVLEVFRKGYKLGDRVVRPAQVKVGKTTQ